MVEKVSIKQNTNDLWPTCGFEGLKGTANQAEVSYIYMFSLFDGGSSLPQRHMLITCVFFREKQYT